MRYSSFETVGVNLASRRLPTIGVVGRDEFEFLDKKPELVGDRSVAFLCGDPMNVYSRPDRVKP